MPSVCIPQGPPSVSSAVHEAAVHPLVLGPCWGHWCHGFGGSGQAPQKPALQAHRYQYARLHTTGKRTACPLLDYFHNIPMLTYDACKYCMFKLKCDLGCYMVFVFYIFLTVNVNPWYPSVFSYCVYIPVHLQAVLNTLSIGASLLLPPLRERTELLLSLLPQGPQSLNVLSKGQVCGVLLCENCLCVVIVVL